MQFMVLGANERDLVAMSTAELVEEILTPPTLYTNLETAQADCRNIAEQDFMPFKKAALDIDGKLHTCWVAESNVGMKIRIIELPN